MMEATKSTPIVQPQNNTVFDAITPEIHRGCELDIATDSFSLYVFEALREKLREHLLQIEEVTR